MTTMNAYNFTGLITSEHRDKPKFVATVSAVTSGLSESLVVLENMPPLFDVDLAVGSQLDVVGLWVGISRRVAIVRADYFSWDVSTVGWDQGRWYQTGNSPTTITYLDDDTYRNAIRAKILANSWDGSLVGSVKILSVLLGVEPTDISATPSPGGVVYNVSGSPDMVSRTLVSQEYVPFRNAGINMTVVYTNPSIEKNDFGGDIT